MKTLFTNPTGSERERERKNDDKNGNIKKRGRDEKGGENEEKKLKTNK